MSNEKVNEIEPVSGRERERVILKTSIIGIAANLALAAFKAVIGFITGSIAIVLDAVNNTSDAASSLVTIIGTKLAGKEPDKEHPFGHGRAEYLSAMVVSVIILYAGIASLTESVKHILDPTIPDYNGTSLIIVSVAVAVKIILGLHVTKAGKKANSDSLINSGKDALFDSVISASTLVAAVIFIFSGLSLEAYLGAVISVVIIKSGIDMLKDTISQLLGEANDPELARSIKETVAGFPDVEGAYDLVLNNYGPDAWSGSIHIEVPDTYSAYQLDQLIRDIQTKVYRDHNVILTAVGVYSVNTKDLESIEARQKVTDIVLSHEFVRQIHGFYLVKERRSMRFDIVISFDAKDRKAVYDEAVADVQKAFPDYEIQASMDTDYAEK